MKKLLNDEVRKEIYEKWKKEHNPAALAREYGVSKSTIRYIRETAEGKKKKVSKKTLERWKQQAAAKREEERLLKEMEDKRKELVREMLSSLGD